MCTCWLDMVTYYYSLSVSPTSPCGFHPRAPEWDCFLFSGIPPKWWFSSWVSFKNRTLEELTPVLPMVSPGHVPNLRKPAAAAGAGGRFGGAVPEAAAALPGLQRELGAGCRLPRGSLLGGQAYGERGVSGRTWMCL